MKLLTLSTFALGALLPASTAEETSSTAETPPPECYSSMSDVYSQLENNYKPNEVNRFVICPNTTMDIGFLVPGVGIDGGQSPIIVRPNTEFLCGHDGKSSNHCVMAGGDFGVIDVPVFFRKDTKTENVKISGFTFRQQKQYAVFAASEGDIEFNDCVFEDSTSFGPVVFNYDSTLDLSFEEDEEKISKAGTRLEVLMKDCTFQNLHQMEPDLGVEMGIVTVKGPDNYLTMQNCLFTNNHYGDEKIAATGYAIKADNGAVVSLENNCFIDNEFRGAGAVLLLGLRAEATSMGGNFATEDPLLDCAFGADFGNEIDPESGQFECLPNQADMCDIDWYAGNNLVQEEVAKEERDLGQSS